MKSAVIVALLFALSGTLAACDAGHTDLAVHLPSRAERAAVSDDVTLCSRTQARFIMDLPDVGGDPTLDVAMVPADDPCVWDLPKSTELKRGVYTLLIRFDSLLTEETACGKQGTKVLIGAFAKQAISFPFPDTFNGFPDDAFRSRGDQTVPNYPALKFDTDDDGRDAYTEVSTDTDPCAPNEPPTITFSAETPLSQWVDEQDVFWDISSDDVDDVEHEVTLTVRHRNAGAGTPVATLVLPTNGDVPTVTPAADDHPTEGWQLEVVEQDSLVRVGAGAWRVRFRPDEPFVGLLDVALEASAAGTVIGPGPSETAQVQDVPDPTALVVTDNAALAFTEVTPNPNLSGEQQRLDALERADSARLQIIDEDIGDDVSDFSLRSDTCPGLLTLEPDAPEFVLTWAPGNTEAVSQPQDGHPCTFTVLDAADQPAGTTELKLRVTPLVNDVPSVVPPDLGSLQLPPVGFAETSALFVVHDPDEVSTAPSCSATLVAAGDTSCTGAEAFAEVRCEALAQQGADWTFQLTLVTAAAYAGCGERPGFDASLDITDVAPDDNSPSITLTSADCNGSGSEVDTCLLPFAFRTVDLVSAGILAGGAGITTFSAVTMPLIEPTRGVGLMAIEDASFNAKMVLVGLDATPAIEAVVPAADAVSFEGDELTRAAADPVNGRLLALVRTSGGALRALLVDLASPPTASTYTLINPGDASVCDEPFNESMGKPVVGTDGTFYLPCIGRGGSPPARLVRIAPDGTRTAKNVVGAQPPCSGCSNGDQFALVVSPFDDKHWVVFPDAAGFVLVDLSTFDNATPSVVDLNKGGGFNGDDIWASAVDAERGAYLFGYDTGTTSKLARITFDGATPALDPTELELGDVAPARLVVKATGVAAPAQPDLIVWPGSSSDVRTLVDLDAWTVTTTRSSLEYPSFAYGVGLISSPDARYAIGPNGCVQDEDPLYNVSGAWFVPWDDTPPFFIDVGLGCAPSGEDVSAAGRYIVNAFDTDVVVLTFSDGG